MMMEAAGFTETSVRIRRRSIDSQCRENLTIPHEAIGFFFVMEKHYYFYDVRTELLYIM
jgi:hypothetical protein